MSEYIVKGGSLSATADAIRLKTGGTEQIEWKENGMAEEIESVYEAGKKSEYDAFWDEYQNYGKPMHFYGLFSGVGWTVDNFKPKYDLVPLHMNEGCFCYNFLLSQDFAAILENLGRKLDTSQCQGFYHVLFYGTPKRLPTFDLSNGTEVRQFCTHTNALETIDSIIMPKNLDLLIDTMFSNNSSLQNIKFLGQIGNDFSMKACPKISKATILSIFEIMLNDVSNKTLTLTLTAVNNAFETSTGAADGSTSEEWLAHVTTKPNWTITLV